MRDFHLGYMDPWLGQQQLLLQLGEPLRKPRAQLSCFALINQGGAYCFFDFGWDHDRPDVEAFYAERMTTG